MQAGILEERQPDSGVRAAVLADPELAERQKQVLLEIYESFRRETALKADPRPGAGPGPLTGPPGPARPPVGPARRSGGGPDGTDQEKPGTDVPARAASRPARTAGQERWNPR